MNDSLLKQVSATVGVFVLLVDGAVAGSQAATTSQPAANVSTAVAPVAVSTVAATTTQTYTPSGGTFAQTLLSGSQPPGYFTGYSQAPLGGFLGVGASGGTFYPGPIGGALNGQNAIGGGMPNAIVTGGTVTTFGTSTVISTKPPGGQLGTNSPGGVRSPTNLFTVSPGSVIVTGGAQAAGVATGGTQSVGTGTGGVIITGGAPKH
jgi:hypothetical protein